MKKLIYLCCIVLIEVFLYGCNDDIEIIDTDVGLNYKGENRVGLSFIEKVNEQNKEEEIKQLLDSCGGKLVMDYVQYGVGFGEGFHYLIPVQSEKSGVIDACVIFPVITDIAGNPQPEILLGIPRLVDRGMFVKLPSVQKEMRSVFFRKWKQRGLKVDSLLCVSQDLSIENVGTKVKTQTAENENVVQASTEPLEYRGHIDYYIEIYNGMESGEDEPCANGISLEDRSEIFRRHGKFLFEYAGSVKYPEIYVEMEFLDVTFFSFHYVERKKVIQTFQNYMERCRYDFKSVYGVSDVLYVIDVYGSGGGGSTTNPGVGGGDPVDPGDEGGGSSGGSGGSGSGTTTDPGTGGGGEENLQVVLNVNITSVELMERYDIKVEVMTRTPSGNVYPSVAHVEVMMRREGMPRWQVIAEEPNRNPFDCRRTAISPGFFEVRAEVRLPSGSVLFSNVVRVEEKYPGIAKFKDHAAVKSRAVDLWNKTVAFATQNQNSRQVREYGSLIYLNTATGEYSTGEDVLGEEVTLDRDVTATVNFVYPEHTPDPTEANLLVVGCIHSHYPLTWAARGVEREVGPSPEDFDCELPGIVYDYEKVILAGDPVDIPENSKRYYTYGKERRATP
ncbi:hypothetical protein DMB45_06160 [Sanguibacteroides justesenii]|uniref:hypothetical protein n=1 Tax=Sanguibacteroides justesenii TaxID=1547597 RepID=UPI000D859C88|nr:hypothetical protein [Sanguibacteroides justesenii]PXZ44233.1 hypothetical protein DMB45_06160 [Sanguibacteroides justesenii]